MNSYPAHTYQNHQLDADLTAEQRQAVLALENSTRSLVQPVLNTWNRRVYWTTCSAAGWLDRVFEKHDAWRWVGEHTYVHSSGLLLRVEGRTWWVLPRPGEEVMEAIAKIKRLRAEAEEVEKAIAPVRLRLLKEANLIFGIEGGQAKGSQILDHEYVYAATDEQAAEEFWKRLDEEYKRMGYVNRSVPGACPALCAQRKARLAESALCEMQPLGVKAPAQYALRLTWVDILLSLPDCF